MIIDEFMPVYDVSERHTITVSASVEKVYIALNNSNIYNSPFIRLLFFLRGLPSIFDSKTDTQKERKLTIRDITRSGFLMLKESRNEEIVIGIVGQFWKLSGNIHRIEPERFTAFNEEEYAKAAWNFYLDPIDPAQTELSTETRVRCISKSSRRKFGRYWFLIGPFSGIIRKEMLKIIKRVAEEKDA